MEYITAYAYTHTDTRTQTRPGQHLLFGLPADEEKEKTIEKKKGTNNKRNRKRRRRKEGLDATWGGTWYLRRTHAHTLTHRERESACVSQSCTHIDMHTLSNTSAHKRGLYLGWGSLVLLPCGFARPALSSVHGSWLFALKRASEVISTFGKICCVPN